MPGLDSNLPPGYTEEPPLPTGQEIEQEASQQEMIDYHISELGVCLDSLLENPSKADCQRMRATLDELEEILDE